MKWMRFRVRSNTASEDIIVSAMADIGLMGAQIEDKVPLSGRELEELFVDEAPLPVIADDDGREDLACLNFYVEIAEESAEGAIRLQTGDGETSSPEELAGRMEEVLEELRAYADIGDGTITLSVTEDIDWRDNWKQYFHKFFIDDVLVLPSWEEMSAEERDKAHYVLRIDPGAAFGTGLHETTRLAVRALERELREHPGVRLLDVGTGSGVLSILALMFGAAYAAGVDLDPLAVSAAEENRDRNGFTERQMQAFRGDLIGDEAFRGQMRELAGGPYDLVVANILPNVLIPLAPVIPSLLRQDGVLIYSGILTGKAAEVTEALAAAGFVVRQREDLGEWCSLTAVRA